MKSYSILLALTGLAVAEMGLAANVPVAARAEAGTVTCKEAQSAALQWSKDGQYYQNVGVEVPFIFTTHFGKTLPDVVGATLLKCDSKFLGYNQGKKIGHLTIGGQCVSVDREHGGIRVGECSNKDDASQLDQVWQVGEDGSLAFLGAGANDPVVDWGFFTQDGTPGGTIQATKDKKEATITLALKTVNN